MVKCPSEVVRRVAPPARGRGRTLEQRRGASAAELLARSVIDRSPKRRESYASRTRVVREISEKITYLN